MLALKSAQDKTALLKQRMEEQRKLGATIDALMRDADPESTPGCSICGLWRRMSRRQRAVAIAAVDGMAAAAPAATTSMQSSSRLFGIRKSDPHTALASAAHTMEARNQQLESRAASEREEAKRLMGQNQKASAMRALKRAKATEKQLEANQAALLAVEQQVDLMAQAQMQKQVATALASSSKGMKAQKKLLKNAESAVDDAQDARDMADDLGNVMAEFAQNGNGDDDDELLAELDAMMTDAPPPNTTLSSVPEDSTGDMSSSAAEAARLAEIAGLEEKLRRLEEAKAVRQALPATPVPTTKASAVEEKAHLLASGSVGLS